MYVFDDLAQVDAVWESRRPGYVYGRFGTPNHTMLEETLAALEGAEAGLVLSSGMGGLSAFLLGAHSDDLFPYFEELRRQLDPNGILNPGVLTAHQ